jgi:hypothetical protein
MGDPSETASKTVQRARNRRQLDMDPFSRDVGAVLGEALSIIPCGIETR